MTLSARPSPHACPEIPGYSIVEQLYLGSRTAVYRALQTAQNNLIVIKILRREYPSFGELVQFRNQYTIAKNLLIPGIIHPLSLEPLGNGYVLVMEDWGGMALDTYLKQQPLSLSEVLAIALQIADILHDLGQYRVVHKDIKPANILIQPESKQIKLIDFSIASLLPKETQEIQSANILEGTLAYLAPEQTGRMNRGIDYRTDFYALGVTLYQLLTGKLPFESDDPLELMHCHIAKLPLSVDQVNPEVPAMVAAIVAKLMAKNAEDRYKSAMGLKHDLEQCLTQWKTNGEITEFELGQRDLSDRFLIPEKLYGRESEVQTLLQAFDRVANGSSELMLVAGFSGIGKTAVVNEVHKPIVRQRGYFIKGKFDQFNRNIPLSAFVQALRDLMGQLLSEADDQLHLWQTRILEVLGENGQVLIEVIPELEQVIGKQPPVPELSGSAAQNRFNLLFQKFIGAFTTPDHPLVMFLDDLQWADSASLQLIKLLMNDNGYLLMLGAYRDNEVSPTHPFMMTVDELQKTQVVVNTITLAPLALADTNHLVADALNCSEQLAQPLTELIIQKTQGNPFFTTQFLKALHEDGLITFNRECRYWECDIAEVKARSLTDDVVEFMALQLQKLPEETQQVLKLAACIGNQFDLNTLAIVSEQSSTDVAIALWKALQEGLLLPTSQIYKFFQGTESSDVQSNANPTYRFLHDRVQQAAYALIPNQQKQTTHLEIGQLLLQNVSETELEAKIFEIVNHWNHAKSLLQTETERAQLAQMNTMAGRKAKAASAYSAALEYFSLSLSLLSEDCWQVDYKNTLTLYENASEAAYGCGKFDPMEQYIDAVLGAAKCPLDCIKVAEVQIQAYTVQGHFADAIATGTAILNRMGLELPSEPTEADIGQSIQAVSSLLNGKSIDDLFHLPTTEQAEPFAMISILMVLMSPSYLSGSALFVLCVLKMVQITVQFGNTALAATAYGCYIILLNTIHNDLESAYEFGQLTLRLQAKFNAKTIQSRVNTLVGMFAIPFRSHLRETLPLHLAGLQAGLETGDLEYVGYSAVYICQCAYLVDRVLEEAEQEHVNYLALLTKLEQKATANYVQIQYQSILKLRGQLSQSELDAQSKALHATFITSNDSTGLCFFWVHELTVAYLLQDCDRANHHATYARQSLQAGSGQIIQQIFYFYDSLAKLALYPDTVDQAALIEQINENQAMLKLRSDHAPMNFQHKHDLVEAERNRILGNKSDAIDYYDRAIAGAKTNGYIQEAALASELAAKFYLDWGKEKIAQDYLTNAYYSYAHWGAIAKLQQLERQYPLLLAPILQQQQMSLSATETVFATTALATAQSPGTQSSSSSSTSISATLDLATVLKASQILSSEIELDKLLATLLHTVLENAGADKGVLLMPHNNQWFVEAIATVDQPAQVQSVALSDSSEVPQALINTVKRTQEPLVIVDASVHPTLAMDSYVVAQQPKSLLCTPILHQGKLVAILYLENHSTVGAFTSDRVELLNFLCAQAAISLENARLYQQAQTYAQQLEQSQLQIVQSEKMASLGNLVAGVAHEINNPIGFLNGSINNAKDYVQDLLDYVALYQHHHPNAAAPVQDKAEEIDLEFLSEDLPKLLASMKGATDRIKGISTSLRIFSRADTEHKVSANLHDGIDSTLLILKYRLKANEHRPAIEVIRDYGDLPLLDCFPGQLNQVFMNILANAIDMFDEMLQKQSSDELKSHPQQITIRTTADANQVRIQICDNGKGMAEEVRAKIFDHLFTTKGVGKGTGLGLAIARQIVVEKHSGSLEVQSTLGEGTEFRIRLPILG